MNQQMRLHLVPPLRARLAELGFDEPLSADSVGLCSSLLDALLEARARCRSLEATCDEQASRLFTSEQTGPPLRKEISRLTRENTMLHQNMIHVRELAVQHHREIDAHSASERGRGRDLSYLCTSLRTANEALERENAELREAASRSYEVNGIVLPSGHEVRWHGRKEKMEAHSPIAASLLTTLLKRVDASDAHAHELSQALAAADAQAREQEEESARLGAQLVAALETGPPAEARRVEQAGQRAALAQADGQIDFLNARCAELEEKLEEAEGVNRAARIDDEERTRYLYALAELRREKEMLTQELERSARIATALGLTRPAALSPFVEV